MQDLFLLELEDARTRIKDMRLHANAFEFHKQPSKNVREDGITESYVVVVVFGNHIVRYQGGYGLDWVTRFEYDLCSGLFDH